MNDFTRLERRVVVLAALLVAAIGHLPAVAQGKTNVPDVVADIMQMMVDMKPKFLRFPGGNFLEGDQIADRFVWKKTLGPLSERPGHLGPWGYRSSGRFGSPRVPAVVRDMDAEPVLAVYRG